MPEPTTRSWEPVRSFGSPSMSSLYPTMRLPSPLVTWTPDPLGSPSVFERAAGAFAGELAALDSETGDSFSQGIAIDGTRVLVGAPSVGDDEGLAHLFDLSFHHPGTSFCGPAVPNSVGTSASVSHAWGGELAASPFLYLMTTGTRLGTPATTSSAARRRSSCSPAAAGDARPRRASRGKPGTSRSGTETVRRRTSRTAAAFHFGEFLGVPCVRTSK